MKTITNTLLALTIVGATSLMSCSFFGGSAHREKGTPIASAEASLNKIIADKEDNEGKRFTVTGYLSYSASMNVYTNRPQTVYIYAKPGKEERIGGIEVHWSENGHNSVFVPQDGGGDESKTIFYDHDGKPFSMNDKVDISFSVGNKSVYPYEARFDRTK